MRNIFLDEEAIEDEATVSSAEGSHTSSERSKALFDFRDELNSTASFESPELHRLIDHNIALMTGEISDDEEENYDDDDAAEDLKDFIVSDNEELECEQSATEEDTDASSSCLPRRLHRPEYKALCPGCARKGAIRTRLAVFQAVVLQLAPAPNLPAYQIYRNLRPLSLAKPPGPESQTMTDSSEGVGHGPTEFNKQETVREKAPVEKSPTENDIVKKAAAVKDRVLKEMAVLEKVVPKATTVRTLPLKDGVGSNNTSKVSRNSQRGPANPAKKKVRVCLEPEEVLDYSELMRIAGRQSLTVTLPDGFGSDFEIIPSEQYPSLEEEGDNEVTNVVYVRGSSRARGMEDYLVVFSSSSQSVAAPIKFGAETAQVSSRQIVTKISMIPIREIDKALRLLLKSKTLKASTEEEPSGAPPRVAKRQTSAVSSHPVAKVKRQLIDSQKVIALATKKLRREHRWASRLGRRLRLIKRITQHRNAPLMAAARDAGYSYVHGPPLSALPASVPSLPNPTFPSQKLLRRLLQKPLAPQFSQS
eukprot:Protomagalhaensia_sp_Gyna_25__1157@NODE_156_length_4776_cov_112_214482_g121_i0_p1_GENE_NODE_156_length_4776_cov_112_214482_g121_i0NODE_156_length_4776_cov_112_214482_g121_i0_p1_ORF_typecomplete_len533_score68_07SPT6_acidic/PF14632_6/6_6e03SPT6_acidic/PF14632_6/0_04Spt5_N/PF11942_8/3_7e03Spt5_N/PF11942_8/0_16_NODE_156_length_4776_cov_112_214482_g121_i018583456